LWSFGIFFPALVRCTKKNLATLKQTAVFNQETVRPDGAKFCCLHEMLL
jgi:hypothetical protein